jgi:tetratricopeptide (TPR) repeat protein
MKNSPEFILLAQARTGSSTLAKLLNVHPDIKCYHEPFNPTHGIAFNAKYLEGKDDQIETPQSHAENPVKTTDKLSDPYQHWVYKYSNNIFRNLVNEIYQDYNGIKHLPNSVTNEQNKILLDKNSRKILLLTRKNKLQQVMSLLISMRSKQWNNNRQALFSKNYQEITIKKVKYTLEYLKEEELFLRKLLADQRIEYMEIIYENIYGNSDEIKDKTEYINYVFSYLGFQIVCEDKKLEDISKLLNPRQQKLNSEETYKLIPSIFRIEYKLGSDENGYLFPQNAHQYYQYANELEKIGQLEEAIAAYQCGIRCADGNVQTHIYRNLGNLLAKVGQEEQARHYHYKTFELCGWPECSSKKYEFTFDWFSLNIRHWEKHLNHLIGLPDLQILEIGSFQGLSTCWLLDNILTHPSAHLTCIDVEFQPEFDRNIRKVGNAVSKILKLTGKSENILEKLSLDSYDLIYIDGCHQTDTVFNDAVNSIRLVKNNGILIFDDYDWPSAKKGIQAFLELYDQSLDILHQEHQIIFKKVSMFTEKVSSFKLGNFYFRQGDFEKSIIAYKENIECNPDFSWSYYNLAEALTKQKRFNEAKEAYKHAAKLNPHCSQA